MVFRRSGGLMLGSLMLMLSACGSSEAPSGDGPSAALAKEVAPRVESPPDDMEPPRKSKKEQKQDAIDTMLAVGPFEFSEEIVSEEPLLHQMIEDLWKKSPIPRDLVEDEETVAVVDGEAITYLDLARECIFRFGSHALTQLVNELITIVDLKGRGIEITEEETDKAVQDVLGRSLAIKSVKSWCQAHQSCEARLRLSSRNEAGVKQAYAADSGRGRFAPSDFVAFIAYMDFFHKRYRVGLATEYGFDRFPEGSVGEIDGVPIPLRLALPVVLSKLTPIQVRIALEDLIDSRVVNREFERLGLEVADEDVDAMVVQRQTQSRSLISWEVQLKNKGTLDPNRAQTLGFVRRKFKLWLGLDQLLGPIAEEEVFPYFQAQQLMMGRATVTLSATWFYMVDPLTLRTKGPEGKAKTRINLEKALRALEKGEPFDEVVMKFSEDVKTRRYTKPEFGPSDELVAGDIGITNVRDARLPDEIAAAGFLLREGEWIGPIRTREGFVIVEVTHARPPRPYPFDGELFTDSNDNGRRDENEPFEDTYSNGQWDSGRRFFAHNELRNDRAHAWVAEIRKKAKVEIREDRALGWVE